MTWLEQYVNMGHSSDMSLIVKDYGSSQGQKAGDRLPIRHRLARRKHGLGWIFQPGGKALRNMKNNTGAARLISLFCLNMTRAATCPFGQNSQDDIVIKPLELFRFVANQRQSGAKGSLSLASCRDWSKPTDLGCKVQLHR